MLATLAAAMTVVVAQSNPVLPKAEVSFYSDYYDGRKTASGKIFRQSGVYGAVKRAPNSLRPSLPFGTVVELTYKDRTTHFIIADTGSYKPKKHSQWFDLPKSVFSKLASPKAGRISASYRILKGDEAIKIRKSLLGK